MRHAGLHGAKKIIVVIHSLPAEPHMSSIIYTENLSPMLHDTLIKIVESPKGQAADNLDKLIDQEKLPDGRDLARTLWNEGKLKKAPTNQIFVTPDSRNKIRLDELNMYLKAIAEGGDAAKKMQEIEEARGMRSKKNRALAADPLAPKIPVALPEAPAPSGDVRTDLKNYSERLEAAADVLMQEAKALRIKAESLSAIPAETKGKRARKAKV